MYKKCEAKVANIQAFSMILMRQRRKVPCLQPILAKVYGLNCLNLRLIQEDLHLTLLHAMILIVEQILLFLFLLKGNLLSLLFSVDRLLLSVNLLWIN